MREFALFLMLASAAVYKAESDLSSGTQEDEEPSESAQSKAGSVKGSTSEKLGPDNVNSNYCSGEDCEGSQGSFRPKSGMPSFSDNTARDETDDDNVVGIEDDSVQDWNVLSTITNTLTTVKDTVQHTVYKRTAQFAENTAQFAEGVRSAIREEFYEMVGGMWERSMEALFSEPDTLLGKFSQAVANKIMAVGLIIICFILDYVFWQLYFSILFILAFDGTILLMFKLWGPTWVYSKFWYMIRYFWYLLSFVWTHPYVSSFVILVLFILSVVLPIVRYSTQRSRAQKVDTIENTILSLSVRLRRVEEKQEEMLQLLKDIKAASVHVIDSTIQ